MPRIPRPADHRTLPQARTWKDFAACRTTPTEAFFPAAVGGAPMEAEAEAAKAVCQGCPVRTQCLTHALTRREDYGVWGGLDEKERAELLREARLAAKAAKERERVERQREERTTTTGKEPADASATA